MRSLSKVIKSYRANVASPITISRNLHLGFMELIEELVDENEQVLEEPSEGELGAELSPDHSANAKIAAEEILRETEIMVKELLANAKVRAEEILADAKVQAEMELTAAEQAKDQIHAEAHQTGNQSGYQAGYSAGKQAIDEELRQLRLETQQQLEQAKAQKQQIIEDAETEIVELALVIAEKVIRNQAAIDSQMVKSAVQAALGKVADREEVVVKVNPMDLDEVISVQEQLRAQDQGIKRFKVISDPLISQGGCVIETAFGTVDGRIERQLSEIKEALLEVS